MSEFSRRFVEKRTLVDRSMFSAAAVLFFSSLLVRISAPTSWLWFVAIVVGEWGHYAGIAALLLAALSWRRGALGRASAALALISAVLFFSPAIRAAGIGRSLPARLATAFGSYEGAAGRAQPLSWFDLFRGIPLSDVAITEHVYGHDEHRPLALDLYRARDASAPEPVVMIVHGGSWNGGSKRRLTALNRYLAREHYAVASINYRNAPRSPFPAAVEDVFQAIDFLKANATELRLDPTRIVLIGRSAGGEVALSAAYAGREPAIRGVVSFYAPADLVVGYDNPSRRWVLDSRKVLENYLGGAPAQKPELYAASSPINFVSATTPATLLIHGDLDPMVWPAQSALLAARLQQTGRPHLYLRLPWATHGCDANLSGPSGQLSLYAIDRFLANVLHPAATQRHRDGFFEQD